MVEFISTSCISFLTNAETLSVKTVLNIFAFRAKFKLPPALEATTSI